MLTEAERRLCRDSYAILLARNARLAEDFYARLFAAAPDTRAMFSRDPAEQALRLRAALQVTLRLLDAPDDLRPALRLLGAQHVRYGARPDHYPIVARATLDSLAAQAADIWTEDLARAWERLLTAVTAEMLAGAQAPAHGAG